MAATETKLMTVEEFRALPEPAHSFTYELHYGELFPVTLPKLIHTLIQNRVRQLLEQVVGKRGFVFVEFPFRPLPEHNVWAADVAFVAAERLAKTDRKDNVRGAPDLVVEVLSPANTASEMFDREQMCLEHGCLQFLVVDPDRRTIRVVTQDAPAKIYRSGQSVPLTMFEDALLAVDDVFDVD